jgi:uncharacterized protein (TIGR00730 family)
LKEPQIKSLCVFCGSSTGALAIYSEAARQLAGEMVKRNLSLVYGGGNIGLMGILADEVLRLGGEVTGVIPTALLEKEVGHVRLTRQHIVKDMHERKAMMAELSDGFIALPGGIGTLDELFEILTWAQLGFHCKPIGLLNVQGFHDGLIAYVRHLVHQGFLREEHAGLLMHESDAAMLLARCAAWVPHPAEARQQAAAKALFP